MELIRLENITKTYHLGEVDVPVLKGISLSIQRGEMVALMGASGSGKTTLMNILGCLDRPSSGQFWFDGEEMSQLTPNERALVRTAKLGFVFQSFNLLARTSALLNVVMPLDYSPRRPPGAEARSRSQLLLERVGLGDRMDHEPSQMSGGQQQRVAIARSLVNKPSLVLADEPTGNLDSHTSVEILQMFQQLNAEGITVILVTHDPKVAAFAHRTIRISDGLIEGDDADKPVGRNTARRRLPRGGRPPNISTATVRARPGADRTGTSPLLVGAESGQASIDGNGDSRHYARGWFRLGEPDLRPLPAGTLQADSPGLAEAELGPAPVVAGDGNSLYGEAEPKLAAVSLSVVDSAHVPHGPERLAAEQNALGPDRPGRDHRRWRGDCHGRDRPGFENRHAEDDRQHGGQQPAGAIRGGQQRRRELRLRQRVDPHPAGRRRDRAAVPGRHRRGPHRPRRRPGHLRQPQLGADEHLRHHARLPRRARLGRHARGRHVHRSRRGQRQQGLRGRHHDQAGAVSGRIARRQGDSHPERLPARDRRAFRQGLQHGGHGPGRHHPRSLDHDQVPRDRQRLDQYQYHFFGIHFEFDDQQYAEQSLSYRHGRFIRAASRDRRAGHPAAGAVRQRQPDPRQGGLHRADPAGHRRDHRSVARAASHPQRASRRLQHPRHDRNHQHHVRPVGPHGAPCSWSWPASRWSSAAWAS